MKYRMLLALLATLASASAGLQFEARIASSQAGESQTTGYVDGPKAKIDFREGIPSAGGVSGYLITKDGGKTIYLVDPESRTYMQFNPAQMADAAGGMLQAAQGLVQIDVKNPSVKKILDQRGPDLLGYSTRHVKLQTAYTLETTVLGRHNSIKTEQTDEMWVTDKLNDPGLNIWLQQSSIRTGNEELDKLIELEQSRINGFPLKVISKRTESQNGGQPRTETTTYEITSIRQRNLPSAIFAIPEDYTDGMAEARTEMQRASESLNNAAQDPEVQDAINSLMRGFLSR